MFQIKLILTNKQSFILLYFLNETKNESNSKRYALIIINQCVITFLKIKDKIHHKEFKVANEQGFVNFRKISTSCFCNCQHSQHSRLIEYKPNNQFIFYLKKCHK